MLNQAKFFCSVVLLLLSNSAFAQTAEEQSCFNAIQGKVAWNQNGDKNWSPENIRALCAGTVNHTANISCFSNLISLGTGWPTASAQCAGPDVAANTGFDDGSIAGLLRGIVTGTLRQTTSGPASRSQDVGNPKYKIGKKSPEGTAEGFVCQTKKVSLEQNSEEFVTLNPTQEWLYPGALLQGNTIKGGTPTWIPAARSPGRIGLAIQSGGENNYVAEIPEMKRLSVLRGVNNLLRDYTGGTPGEISLMFEKVESQEHLEAMIGASVTGTSFSAGAQLNISGGEETTKMVLRLVQKFYTVVYEPPRFSEDVFAEDVTRQELERWMGPGNPPVFVSAVNYGRMLFATLESDLSERELRASFNAAYEGIVEASTEGSLDYTRSLQSTKINIVSFGASGAGGLTAGADVVQAKNFQGIYDFMRTSGDFSVTNPGVPISYQMRSLYDQRPVRLAATTEFEKNLCEPATFGCDDVPGSRAVLDQCNQCGGTNKCKTPCAARTVAFGFGRDGPFHIYFDVPKTKVGSTVRYKDGAYASYEFPRCYRALWSNVRYTCQETPDGGKWLESKDWTRDALCHGTANTDQPNLRVFDD